MQKNNEDTLRQTMLAAATRKKMPTLYLIGWRGLYLHLLLLGSLKLDSHRSGLNLGCRAKEENVTLGGGTWEASSGGETAPMVGLFTFVVPAASLHANTSLGNTPCHATRSSSL